MEYFIAVTSHELPFSEVTHDCSLLVSPTNFSPDFHFAGSRPLGALYVDSGAYHYNTRRIAKDQHQALEGQLRLMDRFPEAGRVAFFHCDVLPREGISPGESVELTLANAIQFSRMTVDPAIEKVGVAQARTPDEMYFVVRFLIDLGYGRVGLGGLANLHRKKASLLKQMIEAAVEAASNTPLHALGVTGANVLELFRRNNIASCDSATPIWSAIYGSLLYSAPLRRYRLASSKSERPGIQPDTGYYRQLQRPLPCRCPVCQHDPGLLTGTEPIHKHYRTIHNYLHLRAEIEGEDAWQKTSLSADTLGEFMSLNAPLITTASASP